MIDTNDKIEGWTEEYTNIINENNNINKNNIFIKNNRFEFEDGKVLEVEIPSSQYSSIYSLISEKNIVNSGQGKGRVNTIINIYITEEVYDKAK